MPAMTPMIIGIIKQTAIYAGDGWKPGSIGFASRDMSKIMFAKYIAKNHLRAESISFAADSSSPKANARSLPDIISLTFIVFEIASSPPRNNT
jgi:hypothetical protein